MRLKDSLKPGCRVNQAWSSCTHDGEGCEAPPAHTKSQQDETLKCVALSWLPGPAPASIR